MKIKPIPFKIINKYKYAYFVINSLVFAIITVLLQEIINVFFGDVSDFTLKHLFHRFFFMWGFSYPVSFVIYEKARKHNEKMQQKMIDKQEEKES